MRKSEYAGRGASVEVLRIAARERLIDAATLLDASRFDSAIAMGLDALEITLKVKICERLELSHLPRPFQIHELDGLLLLSGLARRLDVESSGVESRWALVSDPVFSHTALRYAENEQATEQIAREFHEALTNAECGVLTWLSRQA